MYDFSQTDSFYRMMMNESYEEFKLVTSKVRAITVSEQELCPICPQVLDSFQLLFSNLSSFLFFQKKIQMISLDGNFGLVRKASSGQSLKTSEFCKSRFLPDSAVDSFIAESKDKKTKDVTRVCYPNEAFVA